MSDSLAIKERKECSPADQMAVVADPSTREIQDLRRANASVSHEHFCGQKSPAERDIEHDAGDDAEVRGPAAGFPSNPAVSSRRQSLVMPYQIEHVQRAVKFSRPSNTSQEVRINYIEARPDEQTRNWPVLLLIHGFPLTSRQFKYVLQPFAESGYHCIAPDYTGAGGSSKPDYGYTKHEIAADLHELVTKQIGITRKIHVVSHDIGAMIGHAYASQYPDEVSSITLGECPLPGTTTFEEDKGDVGHFHVNFHAHTDLAVTLISGREESYVRYFFDKQAYNTAAITEEDVTAFAKAYSQPGALRAALLTYKDFGKDLEDNRADLHKRGLCKVPALAMGGARSHHAGRAEGMLQQLYTSVQAVEIEQAGHYIAMENPTAFVREVLAFVERHK
ncbi:hypothetical protein ANO11243_090380 [Dothideomycetidae sp. 11243]|nr:hypothetical protein ANO11243_090380 [fungal sp. No.11243]